MSVPHSNRSSLLSDNPVFDNDVGDNLSYERFQQQFANHASVDGDQESIAFNSHENNGQVVNTEGRLHQQEQQSSVESDLLEDNVVNETDSKRINRQVWLLSFSLSYQFLSY